MNPQIESTKTYNPAVVEKTVYQAWLDAGSFTAKPSHPGEPYTIVIPPPNVTGALHLGHAINNTLQDILIRVHRMRGFNTLWIPGIDHAGIATQAVVEKQLKEKENKTRHDVGREALVKRIWEWKQQFGDRILEQLKRLGCSCDWTRTRFTLDEMCAAAVRETFFKLFKDGLVYRGKRLVNWDVHLQTSISDDEIYKEAVKTHLWHIKYPIVATDQFVVVATTRPETLLGDTAVAVHSQDPRWNKYIGMHVRLPLTDRLIPIIADDILVDREFGSGVVKVTPAHDFNDYAVWQRHQGKPDQIDIINILNPDGTLNENAGKYQGLKRDVARKQVLEDLGDLLVKEEPYETQVGHSDRSKTAIEPYLSDQWFVKMGTLAEPALEAVRTGSVKFHPERYGQQYLAWLGEKRDWPVSRQLWWGHRIPVWKFTWFGEPQNCTASERGELIQSLGLHSIRAIQEFSKLFDISNNVATFCDSENCQMWVAASTADAECALNRLVTSSEKWKSGSRNLKDFSQQGETRERSILVFDLVSSIYASITQDPDVLDTWFSSALWPFSTLGWPDHTPELAKYYPTNVLLTGRDIITLWVARMVMMGIYNLGAKREDVKRDEEQSPHVSRFTPSPPSSGITPQASGIPFSDVVINPTILDGRGERMSKSKGNGVDPVDIIDTAGADALRFTLTTMATETQDARLPVKKDAQGRNTSDKFELGSKFANKIWQVSLHFILANLTKIPQEPVDEAKWTMADRWIISRFNRAVEGANLALSTYRFDQYARVVYDFFWEEFCNWYVEAAKPQLRDAAHAGQTANILAGVLDGALRLMHPVVPFITEAIWWKLNETREDRSLPGRIETKPSAMLVSAAWPNAGNVFEDGEHVFPRLQDVITAIRNVRNVYKVDPRTPVTVSICPPGKEASLRVQENRAMIELLASCSIKAISATLEPVPGSVRIVAAGVCDIYVEDLVDEAAEKQRLAAREQELVKLIVALEGRLSNAGYVAKAPPKLVEESQKQLADTKAELEKLRAG